ncbi:MAG TPA: FAD-containing monooxygenase EthA, partial [Hyphomonas atlantica]|nr:FAD-containing monooxygenase EthA [Hyphomonas atlantica]
GLVCGYLCKLLKEMDRQGKTVCIPRRPEGEIVTRPLMDFGAGYVKRAVASMPKQGDDYPWEMSSDYTTDIALFKRGKVIDPALELF